MNNLFSELRQRSVFRVTAAYLALAWLVLQIIETVSGLVTLPAWVGLYSLVALAVGFPIAIFLAWAYELTPEGIRAAADTDSSEPVARFGGRKIDFIIIGAMSSVIVLLLVKDNLIPTSPLYSAEVPSVSNYRQLTTSQVVFPPTASPYPLVADRSRLYFNSFEASGLPVKQLAWAGGDPVPFTHAQENALSLFRPTAMTPDQSGVLMTSWKSGEARMESWLFRIVDGTGRRLVEGGDASYSTDGRIAYMDSDSLEMGARNRLLIANADGSDPRELFVAPARIHWIVFSPDNERLRFVVMDETPEIWEVSVDGSNAHLLFPELKDIGHCCGSWTDDGRYYVFQATHNDRTHLWAINEGGDPKDEPVQITSGVQEFRRPTVVDNGKTIFAIGWQLRGEVVRYDSRAGQFLPLPGFESISAEEFSYSADGEIVAYIDYPAANLWRSNRDGSNRAQLTFPPMKVLYPVTSRDGRQIAFVGYLPDGEDKIFIVSTAGGPYKPLTPDNDFESSPTWSSDSSKIAFSTDVKDYIQLYDVASGNVESMLATEELWEPDWSPDGKRIATTGLNGETVLLDIESGQRTTIVDGNSSYGLFYWDADSEHMFFVDKDSKPRNRAVHHMRISDGETKIVAALDDVRATWGEFGFWVGIDPDGAPLMQRDISIHHIYGLDWRLQ